MRLYTCNPRVIRGTFVNPLGDGQTYTYEMFYVGTVDDTGNSIGAAFSNDGIQWTKYPDPIIVPGPTTSYGVGQPAVYNTDGKSAITLFYEDSTPTIHHIEATSTDGIHFTVQGTITTNGLDANNPDPTWADMGYDPATKYWYAAFNLPNAFAEYNWKHRGTRTIRVSALSHPGFIFADRNHPMGDAEDHRHKSDRIRIEFPAFTPA